jgi:hypothetical protein
MTPSTSSGGSSFQRNAEGRGRQGSSLLVLEGGGSNSLNGVVGHSEVVV